MTTFYADLTAEQRQAAADSHLKTERAALRSQAKFYGVFVPDRRAADRRAELRFGPVVDRRAS